MYGFVCLLAGVLALTGCGLGAPAGKGKNCSSTIVRKEWRTLSKKERLQYISSVQCLLRKPAVTPSTVASGAISRYDDLVVTHINQTMSIHFVGHFLAWHRHYISYYEKLLREECGYRGAQPYWDWTLEKSGTEFVNSPLFDPVYGFGGNGPLIPLNASNNEIPGRTGGGCVKDGPFRNMTVHLGPGDSVKRNDQCLKRDLAPEFGVKYLARDMLDKVMNQSTYGWFDRTLEGGIAVEESQLHAGGHYGVGGTYGQMGDPFISPSDPIFWMHHTNLDRVWWSWQKKDLKNRLRDVTGPVVILDWDNKQGGNITLDYPLSLGYNNWDAKVEDMVDIAPLCYTYDTLY